MSASGSTRRLRGLLRKEALQIVRDPSSILLAVVMPLVLLFLFGFGVSLDPQDVRIAIVVEERSTTTEDLAARFELSRYFEPVRARSMAEAEAALQAGEVDAILRVPSNFTKRLERSTPLATDPRVTNSPGPASADPRAEDASPPPQLQLILNAIDANRARLILGYAQSAVATAAAIAVARGERPPPVGVTVDTRVWFNESLESTNFLVPGLLTLVMTLIGVLLTALVIAREWERGTMEAILATPLRTRELLLGKLLPYLALGLIGMGLSVFFARLVFGVPFRGSLLALFVTSTAFLLASLGLGLFISAAVRVQAAAAQASIVAGFLPAFFLSGLLFDLESTPVVIRAISTIVPAKYFVTISRTLFLAGDVWSVLIPNTVVLLVMATGLLLLARSHLGLRLAVD